MREVIPRLVVKTTEGVKIDLDTIALSQLHDDCLAGHAVLVVINVILTKQLLLDLYLLHGDKKPDQTQLRLQPHFFVSLLKLSSCRVCKHVGRRDNNLKIFL